LSDPVPTHPAATELATGAPAAEASAKKSSAWKWVAVGFGLTTAFTLLGKLPPAPMSAGAFGSVIGNCVSGGLYGALLWWLLRGRKASR
jgi:hypothetical protein